MLQLRFMLFYWLSFDELLRVQGENYLGGMVQIMCDGQVDKLLLSCIRRLWMQFVIHFEGTGRRIALVTYSGPQ